MLHEICDITTDACKIIMAVKVNSMEQELALSVIPDVLEDFFVLFHLLLRKVGAIY